MKTKIKYIVVWVLIITLVAAAFPATGLAKDNKTYFTGTECSDKLIDMGVWAPLGNGGVRVTGLLSSHVDDTNDPRLNGTAYTEIYMILNADMNNGHAHGTFQLSNSGGSWSGEWVGILTNGSWYIEGLFHGDGGYAGLVDNYSYRPEGECAAISGYIVETGAGH